MQPRKTSASQVRRNERTRFTSLLDPIVDSRPTPSKRFVKAACLGPGFALHIRTRSGTSVLIDTGNSPGKAANSKFVANASCAGIDLGDVDVLILSHLHLDHAGGLETFLTQNDKAKIYVKLPVGYGSDDVDSDEDEDEDLKRARSSASLYFRPLCCLPSKYVGPCGSPDAFARLLSKYSARIINTTRIKSGVLQVSNEVYIVTQVQHDDEFPPPSANWPLRFYRTSTKSYHLDDFRHEQFVVVECGDADEEEEEEEEGETSLGHRDEREGEGEITVEVMDVSKASAAIISPCSHSGILNVVQTAIRKLGSTFHFFHVLGGFHFYTPPCFYEKPSVISKIAKELRDGFDGRIASTHTWHCTSRWGYRKLFEEMHEKVNYLKAGATLDL